MQTLTPLARRGLVVLGAATLLTAVVIGWPALRRRAPSEFDPFAAIPRDVTVIVRMDVPRLARARDRIGWSRIEPSLPAGRSIATLCRFDPFTTLHELVLVVPKRRTPSSELEIGLAASGAIAADSVVECAERVLRDKGRTPVRSRIDSFRSVRARDGSDVEVAVRDGGPLLVGNGAILRDMIDRAEGRAPNAVGTKLYQNVSLASHAISAALLFDPHWVEAVSTPAIAARSPFTDMRSALVTIDVDQDVRLSAELDCADHPAAERLEQTLRGVGDALEGMLREEYSIERDMASISTDDRHVRATLTLRPAIAERVVSALFAGGAASSAASASP